MKLSVSLPEEDVRFLDEYATNEGIDSRSAVLHRAVRLLQSAGLGRAYELAWQEWDAGHKSELWDSTVEDGIDS